MTRLFALPLPGENCQFVVVHSLKSSDFRTQKILITPNGATSLVGLNEKPDVEATFLADIGGKCTAPVPGDSLVRQRGAIASPRDVRRLHPYPQRLAASRLGLQNEELSLLTPSSLESSITPSDITPFPIRVTLGDFETQKGVSNGEAQSTTTLFARFLVEYACKSLTEIWNLGCDVTEPFPSLSTQTTMSTQPTPKPLSLVHPDGSFQFQATYFPPHQVPAPPPPYFSSEYGTNAAESAQDLLPLQKFVCHMLRRSRTTNNVLQSALCYIEALRSLIPAFVELERSGLASKEASSAAGHIELAYPLPTTTTTKIAPDHVHVVTTGHQSLSRRKVRNNGRRKKRFDPMKPLPPLPPLPSPLLCPRRSFLAALILATKFLQDQCPSNLFWAKLSGLAPREVSRCERSLGEALDWRLWVGKASVASLQ